MSKFRFAVLPDMHLGGSFRVRDSRLRSFWQVSVNYALQAIVQRQVDGSKFDAVISAGDLFDSARVSDEELAYASSLIRGTGVPFLFINGTHDRGSFGVPLSLGGEHIVKGRPFYDTAETPRLMVVGIEGHENVGETMKAYTCSLPTIFVVHAQYAGIMAFNAEFTEDDIPPGTVCVLAGHIHQPATMTTTSGVKVISLGSAFPLRFSDSAFCYLRDVTVELDDNGKLVDVTVEDIPLPTYPMFTMEIRQEEDMQAVRTHLEGQTVFNLMRLQVTADFLDAAHQLKAQFGEQHLIEWTLEGSEEEEQGEEWKPMTMSLEDVLATSVKEDDVRSFLQSLLQTRTPATFLREHREQALK